MKSLLLLPDFGQSGEINVWGDGILSPIPVSICGDIPLTELPDCFILGIPESLLRVNVERDFIYAQYTRLNSGQSILSFSMRGGHDKSGRTVVLSILQLLEPGEPLKFPSYDLTRLPASVEKCNEVKDRVTTLIKLLQSDTPANIKDMIQAVKQYPKIRSFASDYTKSLAQSPQWTPLKKKEHRFAVGALIVFILLISLVIAF